MDDALSAKADALCHALGYEETATFFNRIALFDRAENLSVVTTAFETIGIHSVFGLSDGAAPDTFKPVVFIAVAKDADEAVRLHRRVWTQGVVPLLIIVLPEAVEVRDAFRSPQRPPRPRSTRMLERSMGLSPMCQHGL